MRSMNVPKPASFVLVSSTHGTMIVNRNDYCIQDGRGFGMGFELFQQSCAIPNEIAFALALIELRRINFGDGVLAVDCGANIGVHTIEWAHRMTGWGQVHAFEPQEKIYYALAGNVVLNNCLNVTAWHAAVGAECGTIAVPQPNYLLPASYGSLELRKSDHTQYIGQDIDYGDSCRSVNLVTIDSLGLQRLDFMKIDVEGMEMEVLKGAPRALSELKPQLLIEIIKSDSKAIIDYLEKLEYHVFPMGINVIAVHAEDPALDRIQLDGEVLRVY